MLRRLNYTLFPAFLSKLLGDDDEINGLPELPAGLGERVDPLADADQRRRAGRRLQAVVLADGVEQVIVTLPDLAPQRLLVARVADVQRAADAPLSVVG